MAGCTALTGCDTNGWCSIQKTGQALLGSTGPTLTLPEEATFTFTPVFTPVLQLACYNGLFNGFVQLDTIPKFTIETGATCSRRSDETHLLPPADHLRPLLGASNGLAPVSSALIAHQQHHHHRRLLQTDIKLSVTLDARMTIWGTISFKLSFVEGIEVPLPSPPALPAKLVFPSIATLGITPAPFPVIDPLCFAFAGLADALGAAVQASQPVNAASSAFLDLQANGGVRIPTGALSGDTLVVLSAKLLKAADYTDLPSSVPAKAALEVTPHGQTFASDVMLDFVVDSASLENYADTQDFCKNNIIAFSKADASATSWTAVTAANMDCSSWPSKVTVKTKSFSIYVVGQGDPNNAALSAAPTTSPRIPLVASILGALLVAIVSA